MNDEHKGNPEPHKLTGGKKIWYFLFVLYYLFQSWILLFVLDDMSSKGYFPSWLLGFSAFFLVSSLLSAGFFGNQLFTPLSRKSIYRQIGNGIAMSSLIGFFILGVAIPYFVQY
ncbi:MAG: hypothetical protein IH923_12030 [Nitrospinae bacterium]|nr:hypothetical protein [Nitrospinota bacterium]